MAALSDLSPNAYNTYVHENTSFDFLMVSHLLQFSNTPP